MVAEGSAGLMADMRIEMEMARELCPEAVTAANVGDVLAMFSLLLLVGASKSRRLALAPLVLLAAEALVPLAALFQPDARELTQLMLLVRAAQPLPQDVSYINVGLAMVRRRPVYELAFAFLAWAAGASLVLFTLLSTLTHGGRQQAATPATGSAVRPAAKAALAAAVLGAAALTAWAQVQAEPAPLSAWGRAQLLRTAKMWVSLRGGALRVATTAALLSQGPQTWNAVPEVKPAPANASAAGQTAARHRAATGGKRDRQLKGKNKKEKSGKAEEESKNEVETDKALGAASAEQRIGGVGHALQFRMLAVSMWLGALTVQAGRAQEQDGGLGALWRLRAGVLAFELATFALFVPALRRGAVPVTAALAAMLPVAASLHEHAADMQVVATITGGMALVFGGPASMAVCTLTLSAVTSIAGAPQLT